MAVANLLKHKVHFSFIGHDPDPDAPNMRGKGYHYISNVIDNGKSMGFKSIHYVYYLNTPLLSYILSTMRYDKRELETLYYPISWKAIIKFHLIREEDHKDHIIESVRYEDDFSLLEGEITFYAFHPRNLVDDKFSIYVEAYIYYYTFMLREEFYNSESTDEEEYTPPIETYRQDHCVVCLESKPNVLYLDCLHIAVCDSCDQMKIDPSLTTNCDVCRAKISKRIKI